MNATHQHRLDLKIPQRSLRVYEGDARDLSFLPPASVDLIVTSPPYWKCRDYGGERQLGQEPTPEAYVDELIKTLDGWVRLLKPHASIFINIGDVCRGGFRLGIPARFELAARRSGWNVLNHIIWSKAGGMPEPLPYRLAARHEPIFHLTKATRATSVYCDLYALEQGLGRSSNPGDVWDLPREISRSDHMAPFPSELCRRAILFACPERICAYCGRPHLRRLRRARTSSRPAATKAMKIFSESGLGEEHLDAIRAVGINDAGKVKNMATGASRNSAETLRLAKEAKEVLGGYFRELTHMPKEHAGWDACPCDAPDSSGMVLDPFVGSGTTLRVAAALRRRAIGVDLHIQDELRGILVKPAN